MEPEPEMLLEHPELAELAAAGRIPPLHERLPEDPLVIPWLYGPGEYGGTIETVQSHNRPGYRVAYTTNDGLVRYDPEGREVIPNFARDYEVSNGGRTFTFFLRRGVKWNTGTPFTVEDIRFWWEDIMNDKELTPSIFNIWKNEDGTTAEFAILDDYTIQWNFKEPEGNFMSELTVTLNGTTWAPSEYLKPFHIKYGDKDQIEKWAKEESLESWVELFQKKNDWYIYSNPDLPVLYPWHLVTPSPATRYILERNMYYWKVDTMGRQLPYIDRWAITAGTNQEVINLKIIQGEINYVEGSVSDFTLYKENEAKGGYEVKLYNSTRTGEWNLMPNQTVKEPVLREIFRDVRFRRALSLAVNREQINELMYLGLGRPMQVTISPDSPYFKEEWALNYSEFDLERANALLDEMGLKWDSDKKYRLRPDGDTLSVVIESSNQRWEDGFGIVKNGWEAIGIKTDWSFTDTANFRNRVQTGDVQVGVWSSGGNYTISSWFPWIPLHYLLYWASDWGRWGMTDGAEGEEPPAQVKELITLFAQFNSAIDAGEKTRAAQAILDIHSDNLWFIGTVGMVPIPFIIKGIENMAENTFLSSPIGQMHGKHRPEQWWMPMP